MFYLLQTILLGCHNSQEGEHFTSMKKSDLHKVLKFSFPGPSYAHKEGKNVRTVANSKLLFNAT